MNFAAIGLGTIPQWGTAAIALGALITGWISIGAQREIARKRAALDFFAKTEMDKDLLSAHTNYTQAVAKMQTFLHGAEDLAHFIEAYSEQYWAIRSYLNLHELMSVASNAMSSMITFAMIFGQANCCDATPTRER